jgi:hypothetical protein
MEVIFYYISMAIYKYKILIFLTNNTHLKWYTRTHNIETTRNKNALTLAHHLSAKM